MIKNHVLNELTTIIKERIPKGQNLANYLTDALCLGKEAVYRRLRGEVAFTINEVALLSNKLGISIDQIIGNHFSNRVTFDLNMHSSSNALESYYEIGNRYLQLFNYVKDDDSTEICTVSNVLPFTLYSSYKYLSRFRLARWIYQNGQTKTPNSLSDINVEERIINVHKQLGESIKQCSKTYFIWDTHIFLSFVEEIKYFASLSLISPDDVAHMKEELYDLLYSMEALSIKGEFSKNKKVYFYLSNIHFEATYSYIEKKDFQISMIRLYSINSMDSQSPQICQMQRNWIQSLKRHSVLISGSGEAQRISFLKKQKAIIDTL